MTNLFINKDDEIKVNFVVGVGENGKIYTSTNKEDIEGILTDIKHTVEEYTVIFKKPSFKDIIEINNRTMVGTQDGLAYNPVQDRYQRMVKLIKSWTLVDSAGKAIEPTGETIGTLHPTIASTIATLLEMEIGTF